ncbi:MAG: hypothetical protein JEZ11_12135 [Desulfobacterales bacterium]|nr:hypothetical protein [Desulfobacterales bacterium]
MNSRDLLLKHLQAGNVAEAIKICFAEIKKDKPEEVFYASLCEIYVKSKENESGLRYVQEGIRHYPGSSSLWNLFGLLLRNVSKLDEACRAFEKATSCKPTTVQAYYNLGRLQGEAMSFHRSEDIHKGIFGHINVSPPEYVVFSCFGEQGIIEDILSRLPSSVNQYCVDIGASDGVTFSNAYSLFKKGWNGFCAEVRKLQHFELSYVLKELPHHIICTNNYITPLNVNRILSANDVPKNIGFLTLDIDSYDYFVLAELLKEFRPALMCVEMNELFPPPIKFALKYVDNIKGLIIGQSITMLYELLKKFNYSIIGLEYNNVFVLDNAYLDVDDLKTKYKSLTDMAAYKKGIVEKEDWELKMPWNREKLSKIWQMSPKERYLSLKQLIDRHPGMYEFSEN